MTLRARLLVFLGLGREASPAASTAPSARPVAATPAVPVHAVGDAPAAPPEVPTMDRFPALIEGVLGREGAYANHPADRGGETMWGITAARARAAGYSGAMRDMPRTTAVEIYRLYYWRQPGFDRIAELDTALGERLLDAGINCGTGRAGQWLQRALNALNNQGRDYADLTVDGVCGAMTRSALAAFISRRGAEGRAVLLECVKTFQGAHYLTLAESDKSQEAFLFGWIRARILSLG